MDLRKIFQDRGVPGVVEALDDYYKEQEAKQPPAPEPTPLPAFSEAEKKEEANG